MIVVSDTSPILNLARIGRIDRLASLYKQVAIPPAVRRELLAGGQDLPVSPDEASLPWLITINPVDELWVRALQADLDPGEAEAIVLAWELQSDILLIDERRGRKIAAACNVRITGLLGVLAEAKRAGLIERVKPVLDELIGHARFWIGSELYDSVLSEMGEG